MPICSAMRATSTATMLFSSQPERILIVSGMRTAARTARKQFFEMRQIAQQSRAAALHHFFHRAAEIDVDLIEAEIFGKRGGRGHHARIGAENLRGDGMLVLVEIKIVQRARRIARQPFGAGEFRHDQAARAERANHAAENGVGDARHRRENRRRANRQIANF